MRSWHHMILILCLHHMMSGCGYFKKDNKEKPSMAERLQDLKVKRVFYLDLGKDHRDDFGWPADTKCDGLLFSSLYSFAGADVDIEQDRDEDGKWYRHPARDCYPKDSISSISRDMILGLLFHLWKEKDLSSLEALAKYDKDHDGVMGDSDGSTDGKTRVTMTPTLRATIYELIHQLGGEDNKLRKVPQVWGPTSGFESHLQVLHLLIRGMAIGAISDYELDTLKGNAKDQPENALFSAVYHKFKDGDQNDAVDRLLDESLFPADRLPTSEQHCVFYLYNHDKNDADWNPCEPKTVWSGIDFLFATSVILDESFGLLNYE